MARTAELIAFASRAAMAERLADLAGAVIAGAIGKKGRASLALSGGSTPKLLYQCLARNERDWSKIDVTLVDERWVPPGAEGSNETFVRDSLFLGADRAHRFIGLWSDAKTLEEGAIVASRRFAEMKKPLDVAVLGLGNDGHTASWFPHAAGLSDALSMENERVVPVRAALSDSTGAIVDRLTLTLGAVANARLTCLLMFGEEKRATFEKALGPGPVEDMPVRAILRARPDLWVCWAP